MLGGPGHGTAGVCVQGRGAAGPAAGLQGLSRPCWSTGSAGFEPVLWSARAGSSTSQRRRGHEEGLGGGGQGAGLAAAFMLPFTSRAAGGMRRGNMGHLTRIANAVVRNLERGAMQTPVGEVIQGEPWPRSGCRASRGLPSAGCGPRRPFCWADVSSRSGHTTRSSCSLSQAAPPWPGLTSALGLPPGLLPASRCRATPLAAVALPFHLMSWHSLQLQASPAEPGRAHVASLGRRVPGRLNRVCPGYKRQTGGWTGQWPGGGV